MASSSYQSVSSLRTGLIIHVVSATIASVSLFFSTMAYMAHVVVRDRSFSADAPLLQSPSRRSLLGATFAASPFDIRPCRCRYCNALRHIETLQHTKVLFRRADCPLSVGVYVQRSARAGRPVGPARSGRGRAVNFCVKNGPGRAEFLQTYIFKLVMYILWFPKFVSSQKDYYFVITPLR